MADKGARGQAIRQHIIDLIAEEGPCKTNRIVAHLGVMGFASFGKNPSNTLSAYMCNRPDIFIKQFDGWDLRDIGDDE